jgi:hypothetical protein
MCRGVASCKNQGGADTDHAASNDDASHHSNSDDDGDFNTMLQAKDESLSDTALREIMDSVLPSMWPVLENSLGHAPTKTVTSTSKETIFGFMEGKK